jgi:pyruvate dehydrogenase E2 component (dihydrolipoamide acetyltransferase)
MIKEVLLPNIGEGIETADVSEVLVKVGDLISIDDPILVLESEKATMEIPSSLGGSVKSVYVKTGEQISPGHVLITVELAEKDKDSTILDDKSTDDENVSKKSAKKMEISNTKKPPEIQTTQKIVDIQKEKVPFASPAVRRFARELGANLSFVTGTGSKSRITKEDVQEYIKRQLSGQVAAPTLKQPEVDFSVWGSIEHVPLNKIRKITGERMTSAWQTVPQVTNFDKVDIMELDRLRHSLQMVNSNENVKITLLPFLMKASAKALEQFPDFNSSLSGDGNSLILKKYYHIRIAIDTPEGLMVPVIRDVDKKNIFELSKELADAGQRARNKRISPDDLAGGTFTISSLGGIGGTYFTPIVNQPEVAILGVSRAQQEAIFNGEDFDSRLMLPLTMSYDHRVIDGAMAARFMKFLNELLSDINNLSDVNLV